MLADHLFQLLLTIFAEDVYKRQKETTASPITLSNRISQEMYRLHRLVPLAKRINEKSYNCLLYTSNHYMDSLLIIRMSF